MRKLVMIALLAFAAPALASDVTEASVLGTTPEDVRSALTAMGYEVRKVEMEDGQIEAYFLRDGHRGEVHVDPRTGAVTRLETK